MITVAAKSHHASFTRLVGAREYDPFRLLGRHRAGEQWLVRTFQPHASAVFLDIDGARQPLTRVHKAGVFEWSGAAEPTLPYRLVIDHFGREQAAYDAYAFVPESSSHDLYLFSEGRNYQSYRLLGAHVEQRLGVQGVCFRVWAPNVERASVIGDFNNWDGRVHQMASLGASGVWELFIPGLDAGALYKFELRNRNTGAVITKADPYAQRFELRPATAAMVVESAAHAWKDGEWMERRAQRDWLHAPMSVYELHLGSWRRHADGRFYSYRELAQELVPYVSEMGFTHIELMPVTEHPLDESWGYQTTGYFAATSRHGAPDDLRHFVDTCHQAGIGVILDWVPGHFPQDDWALGYFDGTALYEHADPRLGTHPDWGTNVFNYGRREVKSFLLSSAYFWLREFHIDGLRVDAVASMLYLDYSRGEGQWLPNRYGGRENLEAIEFLREMNVMVHQEFPGALTVAEESTAWPMVSRPTYLGGLGFSMKWNMGWMNDTLAYIGHDPIYRRFHQHLLTFGQVYAYSENFMLPLSHDEVVHGKRSLLDKMPGDAWQKFANLRLLFTYQTTTPGKKLNFMGNEIAQWHEWRPDRGLDWDLLEESSHRGAQLLLRDLNRLYATLPALHQQDFEGTGFSWIDCHDADQSVISFLRYGRDGSFVVVALNFTPVPRHGYRLGVPTPGLYGEVLNSDSAYYGGSNTGNGSGIAAVPEPWMGRPASIEITLPPLAGMILQLR